MHRSTRLALYLLFGLIASFVVAIASLLALPHRLRTTPISLPSGGAVLPGGFGELASDLSLSVAVVALRPGRTPSAESIAPPRPIVPAPSWIAAALRRHEGDDSVRRLHVVATGWPLRVVLVATPVPDFGNAPRTDYSALLRGVGGFGGGRASRPPSEAEVVWAELAQLDAVARTQTLIGSGRVGIDGPGLLSSTVFYAAFGWCAMRAWRFSRQVVRASLMARGICPTCRYPNRAGSRRCPECGREPPSPTSSASTAFQHCNRLAAENP